MLISKLKVAKRKVNTHTTPGFKDQMRIGAALANQLTPIRGPQEVAKMFGISTQRLRVLECQALYKVRCRMLEASKEIFV